MRSRFRKYVPFLYLTIVLWILNSCQSALSVKADEVTDAPRPNIILVMTDDQGWFDAGFNGNSRIRTPNLDRLASMGIIFDRFYSASAVCSPTRASVITGRNPMRMDIPNANAGHMKVEEITLPEILQKEGYQTGHFGKWHLGTLTTRSLDANRGGREEHGSHFSIPGMHGYNEFFCTESKVPTYDPMIRPVEFEEGESLRFGWKAIGAGESSDFYGTAYWNGRETKDTANLQGDDTRVIMDRVLPFIHKSVKNDRPFFTTVWLHTPHLPVVADGIHRNYYESLALHEQIYFGTITAMDEQMGRLWSALEELGIEDETMLWFCSDNGPENNTPGSTGGLRERKRSLYEGGVRVPAFVVWKDHLKGNIRADFPAVTSDYMPTILDMLEIRYPDRRPLDGESLAELLSGKKSERDFPIGFLFNDQISWVDNRYKLISTDKGQRFELYDLASDREEEHNLIEQEPDIARKMKTAVSAWMISVEASKAGHDY